MHARTRVENNIVHQLRHRLLGVTLHCAVIHWQVVSRRSFWRRRILFCPSFWMLGRFLYVVSNNRYRGGRVEELIGSCWFLAAAAAKRFTAAVQPRFA